MVTRAPAGAASSRSRKFEANTRTPSVSAAVHSRIRRSMLRCTWILVRHAQRAVSISQRSPGPPLIGNRKALHDLQFIRAGHAGHRNIRLGHHLQLEDFFLLAPKQRENAVRRQLVEGSVVVEIVLELLAFGLLALAHGGCHHPVRPHFFAQAPDQIGILGKALHQDRTRAFEGCCNVRHLLLGVDEGRGHDLRIVLRLRQQQFGQRLEPGFLGDLGLGAALRLERQVDVFQTPLAVGRHDRGFQRGVELALLADRIEDRDPALLEFAQIGQPLFQRAQLRVVEPAGDFLAIARHERHRGAAVEQFDCRRDLLLANAKLFRDLSIDICHAKSFPKPGRQVNRRRRRRPLMDHRRLFHQGVARKQIDLWMALIEQFNKCEQPVGTMTTR